MRFLVPCIAAAFLALAIAPPTGAKAETDSNYRWCVVYGSHTGDGTRHCYFHRLSECRKAIEGADGVCMPNEIRSEATDRRNAPGR